MIIFDRRCFSNVEVFLVLNPLTKKVGTKGNVYRGGCAYPAPALKDLGVASDDIAKEIVKTNDWSAHKSPQLAKFCDQMWKKANKMDPWYQC